MKERFSYIYIYANNQKISYKKDVKDRPMICLHGWAEYEKLLMEFLFKTEIGYSFFKKLFPLEDDQYKS